MDQDSSQGSFENAAQWGAERFLDHARRQLRETRRDVSAICRDFGMKQPNFTKIFTREAGISPAKYRMRCRLVVVKHELAHTDISVNAVANRYGFSTSKNLRFYFRKYEGEALDDFLDRVRLNEYERSIETLEKTRYLREITPE